MNELEVQTDRGTQVAPASSRKSADQFEQTGREAALLAFARFGAGVVHEVNSPLAVSLLSAQLAMRTLPADTDPKLRRCIERTIDGIRLASSAVKEMLLTCSETC